MSINDYFDRVMNGPPFKPGEEMQYEAIRLASFKDWPSSAPVQGSRLARAGFYYTSHEDEVKCFSCSGTVRGWNYGDSAIGVHRSKHPDCRFVKGIDTRNVPIPHQSVSTLNNANIQASEGSVPRQRPDDTASSPVVDVNSNTNISLGSGEARAHPTPAADNEVIDVGIRETGSTALQEPDPLIFKAERARLETFQKWPRADVVRPRELAAAGFLYTGINDRVHCAFCHVKLSTWAKGDRAMNEHRRHSPTCPFVQNMECGNIPLERPHDNTRTSTEETSSFTIRSREPHGVQPRGIIGGRREPSGDPLPQREPAAPIPANIKNLTSLSGVLDPATSASLGIMTERPKRPDQAVESIRISTYTNWPPSLPLQPAELAHAGFYYAGFGDNVKCFFCDGGLRNWEEGDDPWVEHARWYGKCQYLLQQKGPKFVSDVARKFGTNQTGTATSAAAMAVAPKLYKVEAREIKARLETDIVRTVLQLGYDSKIVRGAIEHRLKTTGDDFPNAQSLLEAVWEIESPGELAGGEVPGNQSATAKSEPPPGEAAPASAPASTANTTSSATSSPKQAESKNKRKKRKKKTQDQQQQKQEISEGEKKEEQKSSSPAPDPSTLIADESAVLREFQQLKEEKLCCVCMDQEKNVVFLPCGHHVCCATCAPALRICPICREPIQGNVRTFSS